MHTVDVAACATLPNGKKIISYAEMIVHEADGYTIQRSDKSFEPHIGNNSDSMLFSDLEKFFTTSLVITSGEASDAMWEQAKKLASLGKRFAAWRDGYFT